MGYLHIKSRYAYFPFDLTPWDAPGVIAVKVRTEEAGLHGDHENQVGGFAYGEGAPRGGQSRPSHRLLLRIE